MLEHGQEHEIEFVDPDPIAIVTICFAGIAMVSGVANTVVQLLENRRRGRDENRKTLERLSDVLVARDVLLNTGQHLRESIEAFRRDASLALSFDPRMKPTEARFTIGANGVVVGGSSREMWDLLVDDVCNNVKLVNRLVLEYSAQINQLFERLRYLEPHLPSQQEVIEMYLRRAQQRAHQFQIAMAKFQSLTSKTPLNRAMTTFTDACDEAERLVREIETFTYDLSRRLH